MSETNIEIHNGDCLEVMKTMPGNSIDSIVTDPPYGLKFMGKKWDVKVPGVEVWQECLRVLKPGGFLLSFGGCRTYHRLVCNIEDTGFVIHPMVAWLFGSGFPKGADLAKAIDKAAGVEREVVGEGRELPDIRGDAYCKDNSQRPTIRQEIALPATEEAEQWEGWKYGLQTLKPAIEPICCAQKPYEGKPVKSMLKWGVGALNIGGCRIPPKGRYPANLIHDGSPEVLELFPDKLGPWSDKSSVSQGVPGVCYGTYAAKAIDNDKYFGESGSASRYFYCTKASQIDREDGLADLDATSIGAKGNGLARTCTQCGASTLDGRECPEREFENPKKKNSHPTVKATKLMKYLCRLVTPPGGIVLDPFMGSGSTGRGAKSEGFRFVGIEIDPHYCKIAKARIAAIHHEPTLF